MWEEESGGKESKRRKGKKNFSEEKESEEEEKMRKANANSIKKQVLGFCQREGIKFTNALYKKAKKLFNTIPRNKRENWLSYLEKLK